MLNFWMIALLTILRIGIPAAALLTLGEVAKRQDQYSGKLRGA